MPTQGIVAPLGQDLSVSVPRCRRFAATGQDRTGSACTGTAPPSPGRSKCRPGRPPAWFREIVDAAARPERISSAILMRGERRGGKTVADLHALTALIVIIARQVACRACRRSGIAQPRRPRRRATTCDHRTDRGATGARRRDSRPKAPRPPVGAEERVCLVNRLSSQFGPPIDRVGPTWTRAPRIANPAAQDLRGRCPRATRIASSRAEDRRLPPIVADAIVSCSRSRRHGRAGTFCAMFAVVLWSAGRHCRCGARSPCRVRRRPRTRRTGSVTGQASSPLGGPARLPRPAAGRASAGCGFRQRESRRHAIDHAADAGPWLRPRW